MAEREVIYRLRLVNDPANDGALAQLSKAQQQSIETLKRNQEGFRRQALQGEQALADAQVRLTRQVYRERVETLTAEEDRRRRFAASVKASEDGLLDARRRTASESMRLYREERDTATRSHETIAKRAREVLADQEAARRRFSQGLNETTEALGKIARGFTALGLAGDESMQKILHTMIRVQGILDLISGSVRLFTSVPNLFAGLRGGGDAIAATGLLAAGGARGLTAVDYFTLGAGGYLGGVRRPAGRRVVSSAGAAPFSRTVEELQRTGQLQSHVAVHMGSLIAGGRVLSGEPITAAEAFLLHSNRPGSDTEYNEALAYLTKVQAERRLSARLRRAAGRFGSGMRAIAGFPAGARRYFDSIGIPVDPRLGLHSFAPSGLAALIGLSTYDPALLNDPDVGKAAARARYGGLGLNIGAAGAALLGLGTGPIGLTLAAGSAITYAAPSLLDRFVVDPVRRKGDIYDQILAADKQRAALNAQLQASRFTNTTALALAGMEPLEHLTRRALASGDRIIADRMMYERAAALSTRYESAFGGMPLGTVGGGEDVTAARDEALKFLAAMKDTAEARLSLSRQYWEQEISGQRTALAGLRQELDLERQRISLAEDRLTSAKERFAQLSTSEQLRVIGIQRRLDAGMTITKQEREYLAARVGTDTVADEVRRLRLAEADRAGFGIFEGREKAKIDEMRAEATRIEADINVKNELVVKYEELSEKRRRELMEDIENIIRRQNEIEQARLQQEISDLELRLKNEIGVINKNRAALRAGIR